MYITLTFVRVVPILICGNGFAIVTEALEVRTVEVYVEVVIIF